MMNQRRRWDFRFLIFDFRMGEGDRGSGIGFRGSGASSGGEMMKDE